MKLLIPALLVLGLSACGPMHAMHGMHHGKAAGDTVLICHKGRKTMEIPRAAADGHLGHGDRYGRC